MATRQSFAAVKFDHLFQKYSGDRRGVQDAIVEGMGFQGAKNGSVILDLEKCPKDFLRMILDEFEGLTENQRNKVALVVHGATLDVDAELTSCSDVATLISNLKSTGLYNAELNLCDRWYPIRVNARYYGPTRGNEAYTAITVNYKMADQDNSFHWGISKSFFVDEDGQETKINGKELFRRLGMRYLQQDVDEFERKNARAENMNKKNGQVKDVVADVLLLTKGMWGGTSLQRTSLGTKEIPKKVVIESELETTGKSARGGYGESEGSEVTRLPFVRAFSLDLKRYTYTDVDDVQNHAFDKTALERLVLPKKEKDVVTTLFQSDTQKLFGDVLQDKHGGMIILATGTTGTGKTLTAEVFAEVTEKPLYVMEMAELGIKVEEMEERLATIFRRVTKWGAVLLMDEADVFLAKRGESLERSVIVGIFLRLMDYYRGLLFLTTNLPEVIDHAFKSRITIRIDYPDLDTPTRQKIWGIMLERAAIKLTGPLDGVPGLELNGRQIRNMVRLIKVIHGSEVTCEQIKQVCEFACK